MQLRRVLFRTDVLFALALFLVGLAVSVAAYAYVLDSLIASRAVIREIPVQEQHYTIVVGDRCVGEFSHVVERQSENIILRGKGEVLLQLGQNQKSAKFLLEATFNGLGQLGASLGSIKFEGGEIRFGTEEINPLRAVLRLHNISQPYQRFEMRVPGPVMLYRNNAESYRIEYLHLGQMLSEYGRLAQQPWLKSISPRLEPRDRLACGVKQPWDLSPLLLFLPKS